MVIGALLKGAAKFAGKKALGAAEKAVGSPRKAATAGRGERLKLFAESAAKKAAKGVAGADVTRMVEEGIKLTKKRKKKDAMVPRGSQSR